MTNEAKRIRAIEQIKSNIDRFGHHVYLVSGGKFPRFAYTIGFSKSLGFELLFCGGTYYSAKQVVGVLNGVARELRAAKCSDMSTVPLDDLGSFSLRSVDASWAGHMLLGAFDFFDNKDIQARQVIPDAAHWTLDVPDASIEWDPMKEPVWRSLDGRWDLPIEPIAVATTNLAALRGEPITEAARWETNQWELFAGPGPDVQQHEMRVVPLSTMLGHDRTLLPVVSLNVGAALWRDAAAGDWQSWGASR